MFDCSKDLLAFHKAEVALPKDERDNMRERRDANRKRLKDGLAKAKNAAPWDQASQGSYAMWTMVQLPDGDHDIDDGVYFLRDDLKGAQGADMTALAARQMVRDAIDDGSFAKKPEVRKNCVRIYYAEGYHVDIPVYRVTIGKDVFDKETYLYELASSDWKKSDARDVTRWFNDKNKERSPDFESTEGQMRRVVRYIKFYVKSRASWTGILSGFGITKLVTEKYWANADREDVALYETIKAIRDRLQFNLVVTHPIQGNGDITNGVDDARARKLKEKLDDALAALKPLFVHNCTRETALGCWDKVFATKFFCDRLESKKSEEAAALSASRVMTDGLLSAAA
ncbi:MAG: hypothetical protein A3E78_11255, partial [Alphaproteobacteria bacterium RIFCSPHIGHO2_12_FULL_63_12]